MNVRGHPSSVSQLEMKLRASEVFYRHLAEITPEAIVIHRNGKIVYLNPAAAALVGVKDRESLLGKQIMQFVHPDSKRLVGRRIKKMLTLKKGVPKVEEKFISVTGEVLTAEVTAVPFTFMGRAAILVILHDITKRRQAEEKLIYSEKRFRALIENSTDAVALIGRNGKFTYVSPAVKKITGYEPEELIGTYARDLFPQNEKDKIIKKFQKVAKSFGLTQNIEHQYIHKDQSIRWMESVVTNMIGDPTIQAYVSNFRDITPRKQLEQQKDEFMGIVSHELKTPVTSLKVFEQVLQRKFAKQKNLEAVFLLEKMDVQINKLTKLIVDLLDITKIEGGKIRFEKKTFSIDALVDETIEEMQRITEQHSIIRKGRADKDIYGDRERLGQVIINFISNAIKYSPKAKKIIVNTSVNKDEITVSVTDFGIGIEKKKLQYIFERYYRESGTKEKTFPGLGLGLYISAEIIKRLSGKIWVSSKKDKGSTFGFSLPLRKAS